MPSIYTYPGVYVEEIPSGVRTIAGVSTSDTAFIGFFKRGPMDTPVRITSFSDFERRFGGLDTRSEASYAIQQYYLNGGQIAWVVRVAEKDTAYPAVLSLQGGSPPDEALKLEAASPGLWGNNLEAAVGHIDSKPDLFNLVIREVVSTTSGRKQIVNTEIHRNLSMDTSSSRYVKDVLAEESSLVIATSVGLGDIPNETGTSGKDVTSPAVVSDLDSTTSAFLSFGDDPDSPATPVSDGSLPDSDALLAGMETLETIAPYIFNILCMPAAANLKMADDKPDYATYAKAEEFCEDHRAFLIVDIPKGVDKLEDMTTWLEEVGDNLRHNNAAVYFPRLEIADVLNENRPLNVGASGTVAGIYARTDSTRGVWKAPAGTEATLRGAKVVAKLTDLQNGGLNPLGVNVLRTFPIYGNIGWGARTLNGADQQASEWKYIPVRRLALYIEESLYQGLKWVVFEPNDEPLWAQIRLNVGAFMHNLFRQGAFQGTSPKEAYFVKCDKDTTTQNDINLGIVNILVGFAPLKPAEFVVIKIQQMAGQVEV
jgi:phage tail sheath protein FI